MTGRREFISQLAIGGFMFGFGHDAIASPSEGLHIESIREDRPEFKRVYTATLPRNVSLKVTIHWFVGSVMTQGELTQPGGRWVLFEPERPADKILDRELLPSIESRCSEILRIDAAFRRSNPGEYTDSNGTTWVHKK